MAFRIRVLGAKNITVANSRVEVYSVPADALGTLVNNIRVFNNTVGGTAAQVNMFLVKASGERRIWDRNKSVPYRDVKIVKPEITLEPGDKIEVDASVTDVYFVASGTEKIS